MLLIPHILCILATSKQDTLRVAVHYGDTILIRFQLLLANFNIGVNAVHFQGLRISI